MLTANIQNIYAETIRKYADKGIIIKHLNGSKSNQIAFKFGNRRELEVTEFRDGTFTVSTRLTNYLPVFISYTDQIDKKIDADGRRMNYIVHVSDSEQLNQLLLLMLEKGFEAEK